MVHWFAFAVLAAVLITAAVTDCRVQKVYNKLTYPAMLVGLLLWTVAGYFGLLPVPGEEMGLSGVAGAVHGLSLSSLSLAVGLIPFAIVFSIGALGGGDVKLMGAVGALTASWQCTLHTALLAFIITMAMGIVVMVRRGLIKQTLGRIWTAAVSVAAKSKPTIPDDSPRIPFSVGIAAGGLIAALKYLMGVELPLIHG